MSDKVKIAAIAGITVFASVALLSYCSPYQTCVRSVPSGSGAEVYCNK